MRLIAGILLMWCAAAAGQTPGFWLTGLPVGSAGGSVQGLSQSGLLAVGATGTGTVTPGFTWTAAGGRVDFGLEPGVPAHTPAADVSSDGNTMVGWMRGVGIPQDRAYRRVGNGPLQNLGVLLNETWSQAYGVSGDGGTVVGESTHSVPGGIGGQAFRWTESGGMQGLGYLHPNGYRSQAYGISRDGSTIVGTSQSGSSFGTVEAFTWTQAGGMLSLPVIPGAVFPSRYAHAANADGSVIAGMSNAPDGRVHAARWTGAGVQDLGLLPGTMDSAAYAISDDGLVVGGVSLSGGSPERAFVWTPATGMTFLSDYLAGNGIMAPANYRLEYVYAISGDGLTFAGSARNLTTNFGEGFVATIPSPSAAIIVLVAPPLVMGRRRRG